MTTHKSTVPPLGVSKFGLVGGYVKFEVRVSHFSVFALIVQPAIALPSPPPTPAPTSTPPVKPPWALIIGIIIALIVVGAAAYYFHTKKKA